MKKIFKLFSYIVLFSLIIGMIFTGSIIFTVVGPSLQGTGITFFDLFSAHLDPVKYQKLEHNITEQSKKLGITIGSEFIKAITPDVNAINKYPDLKDVEYPYSSIDEVMKQEEARAKEGIQEGLNALDDMNKKNQAIIDESLSSK